MALREGIHERMEAEMHHENKEIEARAEEMLEIPMEWNKVSDLMMEEGDILPEDTRPNKRKRDEISQGRRKGRKTISGQRNENILQQYFGGYQTQKGSFPKIGTKTNKRRMSGKHRTSFRRSHRCFAMEH